MKYAQKTGFLILFGSLLRIGIAVSLELGNDEVYYQAYALHLQWNYFDHPPMVALLIRLSTLNLFFQNEFFIRLGPILCSAAGTWLIFKTGSRLKNSRTGWFAAILFNTSFYTSVIAGTFILPDSPQVICWLLSIYCMIRILENKPGEKNQPLFFIFLGIGTGLCIMSKVHGIFLCFGFGGYLLLHRRDLLKSPLFWLSLTFCLAIISPIYLWNLENHFITYQYHQGRISFWGHHPDMDHLLQQVLGSLFYNNPVNMIIYTLALSALVKGKCKPVPGLFPLLLWLSLPLIGVLLWTSLFNEVLPHWSGPAYLSLMLLASSWLDEKTETRFSGWLKTAGWFYAGTVVLGLLVIRFLPFQFGSGRDRDLGTGDITLDLCGWKTFSKDLDSLYRTDLRSGKMKPGARLIADYWFPAGHLDHYCHLPFRHELIAFGPLNNIHQFAWLNALRPRVNPGCDVYFVYPSNYYGPPSCSLKKDFIQVEDSLLIPQFRNGIRVRNFVVYRMHEFRGDSLDYLVPGIRR